MLQDDLANLPLEQSRDLERRMLADEVERLERELASCRKALEPFARFHRWTHIGHGGDDKQILWRKHWLTGERMKLTVDHFRLAAVAFFHGGILPTNIDNAEGEFAELMAQELARVKRMASAKTPSALDAEGMGG